MSDKQVLITTMPFDTRSSEMFILAMGDLTHLHIKYPSPESFSADYKHTNCGPAPWATIVATVKLALMTSALEHVREGIRRLEMVGIEVPGLIDPVRGGRKQSVIDLTNQFIGPAWEGFWEQRIPIKDITTAAKLSAFFRELMQPRFPEFPNFPLYRPGGPFGPVVKLSDI